MATWFEPKIYPPARPGVAEALIERLIQDLPTQQMGAHVAIYRHYKGGWYRTVCDAVRYDTGEVLVVYHRIEDEYDVGALARHTETGETFLLEELDGRDGYALQPAAQTGAGSRLWARPRAMFHARLPDGRHRFLKRESAALEAIAEAVLRLKRAAAHLDSDAPMATSHAAAEVRCAMRLMER